MLYIAIHLPDNLPVRKETTLLNKLLFYILTLFIPKSNPDFDHLIGDIALWLLEFDNKESYPEREIGLDEKGNTIIVMPNEKNYGYWTDTDLKYTDFKSPEFEAHEISKDYFEQKWKEISNQTY